MSSGPTTAGSRARPGRPRTEGLDERVLAAVLDLVDRGQTVTVSAVVAASGVSRAALYRRWPSMTDLVAAALDQGRADGELDLDGDIKEAIIGAYFGDPVAARGEAYTERRFRTRLALVMANPELQRAYWASHVARRRRAVHAALAEGVRRGELRHDLDVDACIDLLHGIFYYQTVVRGVSFTDREAIARCRTAFEVAWRGMQA